MNKQFIIWPVAFIILIFSQYTLCKYSGKIAFTSKNGDHFNLYIMNSDGSGLKKLTKHNKDDVHPSWSPDGKAIVFASNKDNDYEIYTIDANGLNLKRLTNNKIVDFSPSWSPDGKKIVFESVQDGKSGIYMMNVDGSRQKKLTPNSGANFISPSCSPDGQKIAFASDFENNNNQFEIYIMNIDGSGLKRLTYLNKNSSSPHWSPDSKKIAFDSGNENLRKSYIVSVGGGKPIPLTNDGNYSEDSEEWFVETGPVWTADGQSIVFSSNRSGRPAIYEINLDKKDIKMITNINKANYEPSYWPIFLSK